MSELSTLHESMITAYILLEKNCPSLTLPERMFASAIVSLVPFLSDIREMELATAFDRAPDGLFGVGESVSFSTVAAAEDSFVADARERFHAYMLSADCIFTDAMLALHAKNTGTVYDAAAEREGIVEAQCHYAYWTAKALESYFTSDMEIRAKAGFSGLFGATKEKKFFSSLPRRAEVEEKLVSLMGDPALAPWRELITLARPEA